jgi:hypothetical protein
MLKEAHDRSPSIQTCWQEALPSSTAHRFKRPPPYMKVLLQLLLKSSIATQKNKELFPDPEEIE